MTEAPHLAIITPDLWNAVVRSRYREDAATKKVAKRKGGRPVRDLLSGILRCGRCGGPLTVLNGRDGTRPIKVYSCAYHTDRGDTVCDETLRRPVEAIDATVVTWVTTNVLKEEIIDEALKEVERRLRERSKSASSELGGLEREAAELREELGRLGVAVTKSKTKVDALVQLMDERQERLRVVEGRLRAAKAAPEAISLEVHRLRREARERIQGVRETLTRNPTEGRRVVEAVFEGPLKATRIQTPDGPRFQIEGTASVGKMLVGEFGNPPFSSASPAGLRTLSTPDLWPKLFMKEVA